MRFLLTIIFVCLFSYVAFASDADKALALRKGVIQEFQKIDCFHIRYTEHRAEEGKTVEQVVDFDRGKIRKEHLPNKTFYGIKSIFLEDFIYIKHGPRQIDGVDLVDPKSTIAFGSDIYDPRVLCMDVAPNHTVRLETCLNTHQINRKFSVEKIILDGKTVNHVFWEGQNEVHGYSERIDYYIDEPSFRILKYSEIIPDRHYLIESKYTNPAFLPFPTKIKSVLKRGKDKEYVRFDRTITINEVEIKKSFPPETFTLKSLDLPLNTAVVDYRINRRLGYWDGEKLVDDYVHMSAQKAKELENQKKPSYLFRTFMMVLSVLMVLAGIIWKIIAVQKKKQKE
ncbi:MAG: hypothetical protein LBP59_06885 [Planctomycetaceae bacterium]|jgi:hypothetical protein|nr:hypothetical protein [Planctomycetaceae bacterium]